MSKNECLPVKQVLDTVARVEKDVVGFYRAAYEQCQNQEAKHVFGLLLKEKEENYPLLDKVCGEIACGAADLEDATPEDLQFLIAMAETAFYRQTGKPADLADPDFYVRELVHNTLKLEKDLMLFYVKFHSVSCQAHRPVFSKLIQTSQHRITELNDVMAHLGGWR